MGDRPGHPFRGNQWTTGGVTWTQPARARNEAAIEVDVQKLDESWKHEPSFRVTPEGENAIGGRRERFAQWLHENPGVPVEMPEVALNTQGHVSFTNGRHRFAHFRDVGVKTVMVSVPKSDAKRIRTIAGVNREDKTTDWKRNPARRGQ